MKYLMNPFWGAVFIIAGTAIGAGMLALPMVTAQYGFIPSSCIFIVCWFFMTFAALLTLEVNLWLSSESNLFSMAKLTLGKWGAILSWIFYLLLLYTLLAAYLSGLGGMLTDTLEKFHWTTNHPLSIIIIAVISTFFLIRGIKLLDGVNRIFIFGLIITFWALVYFLLPHVQTKLIVETIHFNQSWIGLPVIFTTFGYQIVIPSLRNYLSSNDAALRKAIIIGSIIPLAIYLIWESLILGIIPLEGAGNLAAIQASTHPEIGLTHALIDITQSKEIDLLFRLFAVCAITTSLIGVSLSLFDFLSDSSGIHKDNLRRQLFLALFTFLPPVLFAIYYPRAFLKALEYAGVCVAILLVLIPGLMAWRGRYHLKLGTQKKDATVIGQKILLILLMLFAILVISIEF